MKHDDSSSSPSPLVNKKQQTLTSFMQNKSLYENKKRTREDFEEDLSDSSVDDDERVKNHPPSSRIIPVKQEGAKRRKLEPVPQVVAAGSANLGKKQAKAPSKSPAKEKHSRVIASQRYHKGGNKWSI